MESCLDVRMPFPETLTLTLTRVAATGPEFETLTIRVVRRSARRAVCFGETLIPVRPGTRRRGS